MCQERFTLLFKETQSNKKAKMIGEICVILVLPRFINIKLTLKAQMMSVIAYCVMYPVHLTASGLAKAIGVSKFGDAPMANYLEERWEMFDNMSFVAAFQNVAKAHIFAKADDVLHIAKVSGFTSRGVESIQTTAVMLQQTVTEIVEQEISGINSSKRAAGLIESSSSMNSFSSDAMQTSVSCEMTDTIQTATVPLQASQDTANMHSRQKADTESSAITSLKRVREAANVFADRVTQAVNTSFGLAQENSAIRQYEINTGKVVTRLDTTKLHEMLPGVFIRGRLDGIIENKIVVEVKNRTKRLFKCVREYEDVQVQAYMQMYNVTDAHIVECLRHDDDTCEINTLHVKRKDKQWRSMLKKVQAFADVYRELVQNEECARVYANKNLKQREQWLQNKVLAHTFFL